MVGRSILDVLKEEEGNMFFGTMNDSGVGKSTGDFIHKELNQKEKMILSCDMVGIGPIFYDAPISKTTLIDVSAICRRCFKKEDVLVYVETDADDEYDTGIVFTEKEIISWSDGGASVVQIPYESIKSVDYDETNVNISFDDKTESLYLGEDAEEEFYSRYMYNFIMDILDGIKALDN